MCVIFSTFGVDPSKALLQEGARRNSDGAGVAWLDEGEAVVRWKKGIKDVDEVIEMVQRGLPHPYMIHFRKKSQGEIDPSLTHPFPLTPDVELDLEGSTNLGVLAHNGTWHLWEKECAPPVFGLGRRIPPGLWSDSRMLAYIAAHYGIYALRFLQWGSTGKIGILYPHAKRVVHFNPDEWTKKEGFWMSADIEKVFSDDLESRWPGYNGYRKAYSSSDVRRNPSLCPKCATLGDVNYNTPGRQWCTVCKHFFPEEKIVVFGGGSEDSEKKPTPPETTSASSSEALISKQHLQRIAAYMFTKQWWEREERRAH